MANSQELAEDPRADTHEEARLGSVGVDENDEANDEPDEYALMFEWAELLIAPRLHL